MKKSHKIIITTFAIVLIVAVVIFSYRYGVIAKAKTGYLFMRIILSMLLI